MRVVPDVPRLTDGVVTLRGPRASDVAGSVEQLADPESRRWSDVPEPFTREHATRFLLQHVPQGWAEGREWCFVVEAVDDDGRPRFGGTVSLVSDRPGRAEVTFGSHPWVRGRGLMERAVRLLLEWGFTEQGLQSVLWLSRRGNWASRRLAWRLGFVREGTLTQWMVQGGPGTPLADAWIGTLQRDSERAPRTPWFEVPRVEGRTMVLRRHRDDDAERVLEACSDERTAYWLGHFPSPYTRRHAEDLIAHRDEAMADGTSVHWMVADPVTDLLLGAVSLIFRGPGLDVEVGYWAHPDARGRGVTTEAVAAVVRHAVVPAEDGGLGLPRLTAYAAVDNLASRRVLEANGFRLTGVQRGAADVRDGRHDLAGYDLLASEVRARD